MNSAAERTTPASNEIRQLAVLFNDGRHAEMESQARMLIERYPFAGVVWKALGVALQAQGKDALAAMRKAVELLPGDAEGHSNLGGVLRGLGLLDEAATCYLRALQVNPGHAAAYNNLGDLLRDLGRFDEAAASCRRALAIRPDFVEAHNNLGNVLQDIGQFDAAMASYRRALEISPGFADAHNNLGNVLKDCGRYDEAIASYRRALQIKPDYVSAHSNLLFTFNLQPDCSATRMLAEARSFGEMIAGKVGPYTVWDNLPEPERCLRVGLVSGDLREHPVGYFVQDVLASLARLASCRVEIFAYANHFCNDRVSERIKASCRSWLWVRGLSDAQLAQRIREDSIDILIDLSGHTAHNRLSLFAWKPAPVQASWLGYLGTTGVTAIDYLIADSRTLPETAEAHYSERIWRLPETYLCFTPPEVDVEINPLPAMSNGYVTFGCFNNLNKINDAVVRIWARVLKAVPDSRLFLKAKQLKEAAARQNIVERFAAHGIDSRRLILEETVRGRAEHLAGYQRIDIALDPFPYPGITTSVEGLWMGVPLLTLAGQTFLSRQGMGLLLNAGLPEWIAMDQDEYVTRATAHAADLPELAVLRTRLRQQVLASPVFDAPRFARHFEAALRGMWRQWCKRQPH